MECLTVNARTLLRFISPLVKTNMYVLTGDRQALLVDPHPSDALMAHLEEQGVEACTVFLTHEHYDHICGIHALQGYCPTHIVCQRLCAESLADKNSYRMSLVSAMLAMQDSKNGTHLATDFLATCEDYTYTADSTFDTTHTCQWDGECFVFTHTPGHTKGSCCIQWNDTAIFTGDSLLQVYPVITRLPGGSGALYREVTLPFLRALPATLLALPGHGPVFSLADV